MLQIAVGLSTENLKPGSPEYEAGAPTARRLHSECVCRLTVLIQTSPIGLSLEEEKSVTLYLFLQN
jgi:hypothetical protein